MGRDQNQDHSTQLRHDFLLLQILRQRKHTCLRGATRRGWVGTLAVIGIPVAINQLMRKAS